MTGHDDHPILTGILTILGNWSGSVPIMTSRVDQRKQVKIHGLVMMTTPQQPTTT